jgi:hypothetical protein
VALAEQCGLGDHLDDVLDLARVAWRLDADPTSSPTVSGASKMGGGADLADGESWPYNDDGVRYSLLAQIDCAALPPLSGEWQPSAQWQPGGVLLRIFADCAFVDGTDVAVLAAPRDASFQRHAVPPLPDPSPCQRPPQDFGLGENAEIPEAPIRLTPFVSVPKPSWEAQSGVTAMEEYHDWARLLAGDGVLRTTDPSTLLGEAIHIQHDPLGVVAYWYSTASGFPQAKDPDRALADETAWRVLLHLATDDDLGFNYGGGAYTVVAPARELAEGRYDHATCVWQY